MAVMSSPGMGARSTLLTTESDGGGVPFEATDGLSLLALEARRWSTRVTCFSTPSPLRTDVVPDGFSTRGGHTYTITLRTCAAACKSASTHPGAKQALPCGKLWGQRLLRRRGPGVVLKTRVPSTSGSCRCLRRSGSAHSL